METWTTQQTGQLLVAVEKFRAIDETNSGGHDSNIISDNSPTLDHSIYA
jgi:hypothetical protein